MSELHELQAEYEAAYNEWQELQRRRHFTQLELKAKVVEPAAELIALQAARIASLEAEVAAAVGKLQQVTEVILTDNYEFYRWWKTVHKIMRILGIGLAVNGNEPEPAPAQAPADAESGVTA